MNTWLQAVAVPAPSGIYISGDSRACRRQPNLTADLGHHPARQRLAPAADHARPAGLLPPPLPALRQRRDDQPRRRTGTAATPRPASRAPPRPAKTVAAAQALGIVPGSTMWYDLEGFDAGNNRCRESALSFLSAWTRELHALGYVSGVYSSAGSGHQDARRRPGASRPDAVPRCPTRSGSPGGTARPTPSTSYIRNDGWRPGRRMKQYQGGHDETWGGVTINIDRNYLDLRTPQAPRGAPLRGVRWTSPTTRAHRASAPGPDQGAQCLLTEQKALPGRLTGLDQRGRPSGEAWQSGAPHRRRPSGAAGPESLLAASDLLAGADERLERA